MMDLSLHLGDLYRGFFLHLFFIIFTTTLSNSLICASLSPKQFSSGIDTTADAWGSYDPVSNHPSGFGVLKLESNANSNPSDQYYAAGFLEGVLTNQEIYNMCVRRRREGGWMDGLL